MIGWRHLGRPRLAAALLPHPGRRPSRCSTTQRPRARGHARRFPGSSSCSTGRGCRRRSSSSARTWSCRACRRRWSRSRGAGVELASHSYAHDYALSRAARRTSIAADLASGRRGHRGALRRAAGGLPGAGLHAVAGAAAGGWRRAATLYDSSAFPAAPYYLAKAAVMGALSPAGAAVARDARLAAGAAGAAHAVPARRSRRRTRGATRPLVELPVAVAPVTRVPFIGTFATTMPWAAGGGRLPQRCGATSCFNFELHAVDVLDEATACPRCWPGSSATSRCRSADEAGAAAAAVLVAGGGSPRA